jgi:hypothetical protein
MLPGLRYFQRSLSTDAEQVLGCAAALGVREFDLFRLADEWWHGRARPEKSLERAFVAYMFTGTAPSWVRQFCRVVLSDKAAGRLEPGRFGVSPRQPRPPPTRVGRLYVAATACVFFVFYAMLLFHVSQPEPSAGPLSCQGGGPGLAYFERLATQLGGRDLPKCR